MTPNDFNGLGRLGRRRSVVAAAAAAVTVGINDCTIRRRTTVAGGR